MEAQEKKEKRELSKDPKQILKREKYWREKYDTEVRNTKVKMKIAGSLMGVAGELLEDVIKRNKSIRKKLVFISALSISTNVIMLWLYIAK